MFSFMENAGKSSEPIVVKKGGNGKDANLSRGACKRVFFKLVIIIKRQDATCLK